MPIHPSSPVVRFPFRPTALLAFCALLLPGPARGQETESPISPAGRLRLQVAPSFVSWDTRFGEDGSEPLGTDLERPEAASLFPGVETLEESLRDLLDEPELVGRLGTLRTRVAADRVEVPFRLDVGVTDWLTVGVTVPLVKARTELALDFDSAGANLGGNPALLDPSLVGAYVQELEGARQAAATRAEELCAAEPGSDACLSATDLADDVAAFGEGLASAYGASFLFPTPESAAGEGLRTRSGSLEDRLIDAGLDGLSGTLPLGAPIPDRPALDDFVSAAFSIPSPALANPPEIWELGDVELHAVVRLVDGVLRDSAGAPARARWQVGAGGLARLGTGARDDPSLLLDHPAGDGQTDVEGRVFANAVWGRLGLWTDVRYGVQLAADVVRRVGPPDVPLLSPAGRALLEWTPGNYLRVEVAPRIHLTDELAFAGGYHLWRKGKDDYTRISFPEEPQTPPYVPGGALFTDASLLEEGTEETRHEVGAGLVFNTLEAWREGRAPLPLEGRLTLRWSVAGSGGRTPATFRAGVVLRVYRRLWGS